MESVDPRDRRIAELEALVAKLTQQLTAALARIVELEAKVADLSRNSTNSSKPPSSDPPDAPRLTKKPSGKKRGGQPGHEGRQRKLLPTSKVNVVVPLVPNECMGCGAALHGRDAEPVRHQVVEIPAITPTVTEYQQHALWCTECGTTTRAELPVGVPAGSFGPRLSALLAVCTAKYRMSKRAVREFLCDVLGVDMALGSVANVEQRVSEALAAPVDEARAHVRQSDVVNADETSWTEDKRKAWLWVAATRLVTVFVIASSRGAKVAKEMLGETFCGVLSTDRWVAYNWFVGARQICWSHLIRDFQSWVDQGGVGAALGTPILVETRRMFRWWHRVRDGTMSREQFAKKIRPVQTTITMLLMQAKHCRNRRVRGMADEMLGLEWAFWTFIETPGVDPTNNFGERQIRHAVLWRKGCFGTDSATGSRFVERMLTTIATLRQQERSVLEFIADAYNAVLHAVPAPSLIPEQAQVIRAAA